ncbi:MAG: F0F1 ATP synthase subunit alpha [Candidatus Omnitrophota bacterium]
MSTLDMVERLQIREVGEVREIKKNIARVVGLSNCMNGQLLDITDNARGLVMGFVRGEFFVFILGRSEEVNIGARVYSRMEPFCIPVGGNFLGRIVDSLAEPIDGQGVVSSGGLSYPVFREAPGVLERVPIDEPFQTGILMIDAVIPIGKGQRELIVGDRMTGKTSLCVDAILNQRDKDVVCIYCCVGHSYSSLEKVARVFNLNGALDYTIVVAATASVSSGEQYLAPYTAATLGEYFMHQGRDVLVVFDDLTKHAWAYRQLSLLLERSPGRDAYPGDIFYLHSQLMERAGRLKKGGSMTFLPIVNTLEGDVTGYIPSNLISMTDGQIYLNVGLFNSGFKPAIDIGLSVSRIGNKVQCPAMRELSGMCRMDYVRHNELLKITRFKSGVSDELNRRLRYGDTMTRLFVQNKNSPYSLTEEIIFLYALRKGFLEELAPKDVFGFKTDILEFMRRKFPVAVAVGEALENEDIFEKIEKRLNEGLTAFFKEGLNGRI